ncbi:unnamed protein product [Musa hybrid cultivar]
MRHGWLPRAPLFPPAQTYPYRPSLSVWSLSLRCRDAWKGRRRGKRRGFFLARLWSPRILVSLFILQSIGRPGLGWRFDRRVADPATWNIQRLTRLLPPHFSPLFMCV